MRRMIKLVARRFPSIENSFFVSGFPKAVPRKFKPRSINLKVAGSLTVTFTLELKSDDVQKKRFRCWLLRAKANRFFMRFFKDAQFYIEKYGAYKKTEKELN